jgi:hypothetical protein
LWVRTELSLDCRGAGANNINLARCGKRFNGVENNCSIAASRMTKMLDLVEDQYPGFVRRKQSANDPCPIYTPAIENSGSIECFQIAANASSSNVHRNSKRRTAYAFVRAWIDNKDVRNRVINLHDRESAFDGIGCLHEAGAITKFGCYGR